MGWQDDRSEDEQFFLVTSQKVGNFPSGSRCTRGGSRQGHFFIIPLGGKPGDEQFISLFHLHKDRNHLWSLQRVSVFYNHAKEMQRGRSVQQLWSVVDSVI